MKLSTPVLQRFACLAVAALALAALSPNAHAQDDGFLIANPAGDTLFYAAPDGSIMYGPEDARVTVTAGGEGLKSVVTRSTGGPSAGIFEVANSSSVATGLAAIHQGVGTALSANKFGASGRSAGVFTFNGENLDPALEAFHLGGGPGLTARQLSGNLELNVAEFWVGQGFDQNSWDLVARVASDGNVYADGAFNGGGADFAERFEVVGLPASYEAGDVMAIAASADRHLERAQTPYSTLVAGVYATRPGVVLADPAIAPESTVPVGVVGVVPTKVTAEGGAIRRGDLLVTSSTPAHAMKGDPDRIRVGMVIGKALEEFDGSGEGVIKVLVNVQ